MLPHQVSTLPQQRATAQTNIMRKFFFLAFFPLIIWADAHIFVYHRFGDSEHISTNTSLKVLRDEFDFLNNNGYKVIPLQRLYKALQDGEPIDKKWIVLTIDDSYKSFYENALGIFKEYGFAFTLFVYVEASDRGYRDFMNWDQIREAGKYGEIGLHGYAHHHMVSLDTDAIKKDTEKAAASYKKELGSDPKYYAYPYGEYNRKVRRAIETFGFDLILNQNSGAVDGQSDRHDLDRTALTGDNTIEHKLRIRTLPTTWIEPKNWPKDGKLKTIHATIPPNIKNLEYFVSGYGWHRINAKNGEVKELLNLPLKLGRTRIFLKTGSRQSSIILVKE